MNQLARSTDVLILALRNRVRLATGKEDADNTAQENQLKSTDGTVQKWIRERCSLYLLYCCKRRGAHFACFTGVQRRAKVDPQEALKLLAALVQTHAHTDAARGAET